jgi:hypothetical protein
MRKPKSELLEGFADLDELAKEFKRHPRSVRRWTMEPDGLPFVKVGSQVLIHVATAREWLLARMRSPNPRRGTS